MQIKVPYRINWAGAYLDCINEPVLTSTIDKYIIAESNKREDKKLSITSKEFSYYEVNLQPQSKRSYTWTDYVDGCINVFARNNLKLNTGCDITISNDLPSGLGVSSSAAFIISILKTICYWNNLELSDNLIVKFGYWVEHNYLQIPCGRMDFKAILHEPGIWKIDTSTCDLGADIKLDDKHYSGLLIYNEQHNHSADRKFLDNVTRIKEAKPNTLISQFIHFEECIVDCASWWANEDGLTETYMGACLTQSMLNLKVNIFEEEYHICEIDGVYGEKLVGSGLKGAKFLLINSDYEDQIKDQLKDFNIVKCNI